MRRTSRHRNKTRQATGSDLGARVVLATILVSGCGTDGYRAQCISNSECSLSFICVDGNCERASPSDVFVTTQDAASPALLYDSGAGPGMDAGSLDDDASFDGGDGGNGDDSGDGGAVEPDATNLVDATASRFRCETESFQGPSLDDRWALRVGGQPTYSVDNGLLTIRNAAFTVTPSRPDRSWIYDNNQDRGNQIAWTQPIGTRDFELRFRVSWSSTIADLTLAGIGLTTADDLFALRAGTIDAGRDRLGRAHVQVRRSGLPDSVYESSPRASGAATFDIARVGGNVTVRVDGTEVLVVPAPWSIAHLVIYAVRFRDPGQTTTSFGTASFGPLEICVAQVPSAG